MPCRLRKEEVVTLRVLAEKGHMKTAIAKVLGVCEGTVRYHLRRAAEGAEDGRKNKPRRADEVAGVIKNWYEARRDRKRPVNVLELFENLVEEHDYEGSYRSVLRYMRS
jgi:transposase